MQRWQFHATSLMLATGLMGCSAHFPAAPASADEKPRASQPNPQSPSWVAPPAWAGELAAQLADTGSPTKRKKARNGEGEEVKRSYEELLKNPAELGFVSTESLYRNIYFHMRRSFVEDVSEEQLTAGIVKELKNFLSQAKLDVAALDQLKGVRPVEAYTRIQQMYAGKIDANLLGYATMNGLLDGLKDNYSVIMTPNEWAKMDEQLNSRSFGGIGIYIELDREGGNQLTVLEPIEGTPAANAGVMAGDRILKIDGKPTQGVTLDVAQTMIRGQAGSQVVLTVERDGKQQDISVTRGQIQVVSVSSKMIGKVGYIRLRAFGSDTGEELQNALSKVKSQGAQGVILDLRNNGGGYIDASVQVVGEFAPRDTLVVYTVDRKGKRQEYRSTKQGGGVGLPTVVMINEFSASASEITAGALRDHKLATLMGDHSFGKGSVQQLYPLDLAGGKTPRLKLTVARFYTPAGSVIDRKGIEPQVVVDMEPRYVGKLDKDVQLKKALELLGGSTQ